MLLSAALVFSTTLGYPVGKIDAALPDGGVVIVVHRSEDTPPVVLIDDGGRVYTPAHTWEPTPVGPYMHGALAFEIGPTANVLVNVPGITTHASGVGVALFGPMLDIEYLPVAEGVASFVEHATPGRRFAAVLSAHGGHVHVHGGDVGFRQLSTGAYTQLSLAAQSGRDGVQMSVVKRNADATSVYEYGRTERNAPHFVEVEYGLFIVLGD